MAVYSIIDFKALFPGMDIAAEHYHPDKLSALQFLNAAGGSPLASIAPSIRRLVNWSPQMGLPVFDLGAATSHILDSGQAIDEERISAKKLVLAGDILISRLRSYLKQVAIVPPSIKEAAVSTEFIVLRPRENMKGGFLLPFLLSNIVQTILSWSQDGNEHPRFSEAVLLGLSVPEVVVKHAETLNAQIREVQRNAARARILLAEAEAILTAALGLDRVDLTPRLCYEDTYAHVAAVGRVDAEYFSPRMQNVIEVLSIGGETIGDVAPLTKRRFKPIPGNLFNYIEISDIGTAGTAESSVVPGEDAPSRATWIVRPGDIITSTVRPIRRLSAIILPEQDGFICSSGFAVLRPRDIEPELLLAYLRLPLVAELLNLYTTASMYPAISTADLLRIPFRRPDSKARAKIVAKVRESFAARSESIRLLAEAQRMVESAIVNAPSQLSKAAKKG